MENCDVRKLVEDFIASKSASFCCDGIFMLPDQWRKVFENNGQYFEDWSGIYIFYNIKYFLERREKLSYTPNIKRITVCMQKHHYLCIHSYDAY